MKAIGKGLFGASLVLALAMSGATAQAAGGHKSNQDSADKSDTSKPKADAKAYAQALTVVPNKPYDPWRIVR